MTSKRDEFFSRRRNINNSADVSHISQQIVPDSVIEYFK